MSFEAKYGGRCAWCDERIRPGDDVQYRGEGDTRELIHVVCPDEAAHAAAVRPACPDCFLIHPEGACDA